MRFAEIAVGGVANRGVILRDIKLKEKIEENRKNKAEMYHSIFHYDETVMQHFARYKTIKSFKGKKLLPFIIFDIDIKQDTDAFVLERTRQFVNVLMDDWQLEEDEMEYWYSGRGYHIYMPEYFNFGESFVTQVEARNTIEQHFPETDLALYGASSLIRAPYSLNRKSNRFKIPLTYDEFQRLKVEEIIALAETNEIRKVPSMEIDKRKDFHKRIVQSRVQREMIKSRDEPTRITTCMQILANKGSTPGNRHDELLRLISSWRRGGTTKTNCMILGQQFAPTLGNYEIKRLVDNIFEGGYQYSCQDNIMKKYCDPKCIYFENKDLVSEIQSTDDIRQLFLDDSARRKLGKEIDFQKILGLPHEYKAYMGELVVIWGDTKIGKSTLAQNLVAATPELKWLYLPLENGTTLDSRRFIQIISGRNKEYVNRIMDSGTLLQQMDLIEQIDFIKFSESSVTVNSLKKMLSQYDYDAVVIDTIDQLRHDEIKDYNTSLRNLTIQLRDFTRTYKKLVIPIHHISKAAAQDQMGNRKRLSIHSGLGSSALEQKADKVIGIEGDLNKTSRIVTSLGARDEGHFEKTVFFNKENFRLVAI